jgi:hypothetical protein
MEGKISKKSVTNVIHKLYAVSRKVIVVRNLLSLVLSCGFHKEEYQVSSCGRLTLSLCKYFSFSKFTKGLP